MWLGVAALAVAVVAAIALTQTGSFTGRDAGSPMFGMGNRTYSYYHGDTFDADSHSPRWQRDGVFEREQEWQYEGPYDYEGYGSAGLRARAAATGSRDPIFDGVEASAGVFAQYGLAADPQAGDPDGIADWVRELDTTYSPYEGYSNPYENRLATGFGDRSAGAKRQTRARAAARPTRTS